MMYSFFVTLHAHPPGTLARRTTILDGREYAALRPESSDLGTPFSLSFEEAAERLSRLSRMYCEPDGSFVWVSSDQEKERWQVDGVLYDRNGRLLYVDLKGSCPAEAFDRLVEAVAPSETALLFQLTREAVFLNETEFRRHAQTAAGVNPV